MQSQWTGLLLRLRQEMTSLRVPGSYLTVQENSSETNRYAQVLRGEDGIMRLECIGPVFLAPHEPHLWPMTREQLTQLRMPGWSLPPEGDFPNLWREVSSLDDVRAAGILIEALQVLGADARSEWAIRTGRIKNP